MQIHVNGEAMQLPDGATLMDLLAALKLLDARVAVELNQEIVPRSRHTEQGLQDQDQIEIVHAIGGG
ncbi:MAG: sulfur carrier protein ThiS [Pseudomonadales bacterium]|nr:sulfur carrier protein ThiS [Pseudomonadales bacterium]MCP5357684.1 sulfur carrier protein ThiS [Pseudomonadales bacterium]